MVPGQSATLLLVLTPPTQCFLPLENSVVGASLPQCYLASAHPRGSTPNYFFSHQLLILETDQVCKCLGGFHGILKLE